MSPSVLIVDDNSVWIEALADFFNQRGYRVTTQRDGLAAASTLRGVTFDLLVTDYFLETLDGGKLCHLAKNSYPNIRTIILTSGGDQRFKERPTPFADAVIAKNAPAIVLEDLAATLEHLEHGAALEDVVGNERLPPRSVTAKLHAMKSYLDALHENMGDAVIGVDASRRVFFLNSEACRIFQVEESDALALPLAELLGMAHDDPVMCYLDEALSQHGHPHPHITFQHGNHTLRATVAGYHVRHGLETALLIAHDMSEVFHAEQRRLELERRLLQTEKLAGLGQLAAGISHEINNPLGALVPNLQVLERTLEELREAHSKGPAARDKVANLLSELEEILVDCSNAAQRIQAITRQMGSVSQTQTQGVARLRAEDVAKAAFTLARNELRHRATLEDDLHPTTEIVADRFKLHQVFLNILLNAAHALDPKKRATNRVRMTSGESNGGVMISIGNNGTPIPEEIQSRIFEPFFTTREVGVGTGLGLSISFDIVRSHGGYIEAKSTPQWTEFRVWLPYDTGVEVAPDLKADAPPPTTSQRVLVVDDEPALQRSWQRILQERHHVTTAGSGARAWQLMQQQDFDVVLCDILMPEMTGIDLFNLAREQRPDLAHKFVFLTGGSTDPEARRFLQEVPNTRAYKPIGADELLRLIASEVARRRGDALDERP